MTAPASHVSMPRKVGTGLTYALLSAAVFGSSGAVAKSLITAGWTSGGAVMLRLSGAALVLCGAAAVRHRDVLPLRRPELRTVVLYGMIAMAGTQLAYFNAVRTLDVGVALLLEFLAPVLLLGWTSLRTRSMPARLTLLGAGLSLAGLFLVIDPRGAGTLDPVGVGWGLLAALGLAGFFVLSARTSADLPTLVLAAGGTLVGAVTIGLAGLVGIVPLRATTDMTLLAGRQVPWWVPALWLVLGATVVAYLTGIGAITRLGSRVASFVGLTEVLFAVLIAWVLLAELPGPAQLAGGTLIVLGILLIEQHERRGTTMTFEEPRTDVGA
jgi:drug/metabolite transporter (DMT)-like permease